MFFTRFHVLAVNLPVLKTKRTLFKRIKENVPWADSVIKGHLDNCSNVEHLFFINNLILSNVNMHKFRLYKSYLLSEYKKNWSVM